MSYQSVVLADNPIRYYRLGEASGTVATDIGSQAQNGTLNGGITLGQAGLLTGDSDTAELFDGRTGYIDTPSEAIGATFTLEVWGKTTVDARMALVAQGTSDLLTITYYLRVGSTTQAANSGSTSASGVYQETTSPVAPLTGQHHYVLTYDGTNLTYYFDGTVFSQTTVSGTPSSLINHTMIGRMGDLTSQNWSGTLDEVAIYNTALSAGQVSAHYTAGTTVAAALYVPHKTMYVGRGIESTIVTQSALWYVGRGLGATLVTHYITRGLSSTLITPITRLALSGSLNGIGTLAGTFTLATSLTTTIPGVGTLSGTLTEATALTVTLSGVGTLSGTFSLATALTTTLAGVGTLNGTLSLATALTDTLAGVATLNGTLSAKTALTTTLAGVGTLNGTLSTGSTANLAVTMAGVGTLAGTLSLSTSLASTIAGVGMLTGVFSLRVALSLTCAVAGTLSGHISIPILSYLTATWVTRDLATTWVTRDNTITWDTRDEQAVWKTRS